MRRQKLHVAIPLIAAVTMLAVTSCSSNEPESSPSTPATTSSSSAVADGCAELTALETSLVTLSNVNPVSDGLDALNSAVADSKAKLESAASAASEALKPSVEKVQTAFDQLESSLQGVSTDNLAQSATEIGTALTAVGTSATELKQSLDQDCPQG